MCMESDFADIIIFLIKKKTKKIVYEKVYLSAWDRFYNKEKRGVRLDAIYRLLEELPIWLSWKIVFPCSNQARHGKVVFIIKGDIKTISDNRGSDWTRRNCFRQTDDSSRNPIRDVLNDSTSQCSSSSAAAGSFALLRSTDRHKPWHVQGNPENSHRVDFSHFSCDPLHFDGKNNSLHFGVCSWVLEAMRLYLEMFVEDPKPIEHYSPFEIRKILIKVLTVKDWGSSEKWALIFFVRI